MSSPAANTIEAELWRIFSFYSLHSDPTLPEQLKVPSFIRFCKDSQIISDRLKGAQIELEIARVARSRRVQTGVDYNPSYALSFAEFLNILELLSQKLYTNLSPEIALRRLLLENILLLASRRIPFSMSNEVKSADAIKVVRETCGKALQNIFNYYVHLSETRRNQIAATEVQRRAKDRDLDNGSINSSNSSLSMSQKAFFKDLITYKEYIQFCHDFSLRSTALLTAIQVGEVYLNCVPLDSNTRNLRGMNFDTFCTSLIYMAAIAYRDSDPSVSMQNKVKALLLFMWKHINNREKIADIARSRVRILISHAGSLNMFGSGLFSDSFLALWQSEGFPTYTEPVTSKQRESGLQFLKKVTIAQGKASEGALDGPASAVSSPMKGRASPMKSSAKEREESVNDKFSDDDSNNNDHNNNNNDSSDEEDQLNNNSKSGKSKRGKEKKAVVLHGYQLSALFRIRPELAEFVFLEIMNMKSDPNSKQFAITNY